MLMAIVTSGAPDWLWPAAAIAAIGFGLLLWSYNRNRRGKLVWSAALCKAIAFAALASCLVEPLWTGTRAKPGANLFLLLCDNSQGMNIRDRDAAETRGQALRAWLTAEPSPWQTRLEQDFDVRRYTFDSRLRGVTGFKNVAFDGRSSDLAAALRAIAERFRSRPIAGILLFTDGNATDAPISPEVAKGLPPVYAVVSGTDDPPRDLSIVNVAVSQTSFEDAPVTIRADLSVTGLARETIVAQILDESGKKVVEATQPATESTETLTFRLQLRPERPGVSFFTLRAAAQRDLAQFDDPAQSSEAALENNRRTIAVDRGRGPYHVLYVSGRPNWEYKFLRRAVEDDPQIRLVGVIRVARREPKFSFRAGNSDGSNPLFRGFKDAQGDDTERYDQPVLVRLNTLDENELRDGFPKAREPLFAFHAIVVDDLEAAFFTNEQMTLLRRFVSERGGGFLMLGGQESFRQGKYERTPIEELLPVYLDRPPESQPGEGVRLQLTREGWLQPWVRLRDNEPDERKRLGEMPEFRSLNRVRGIKPGASVLATVASEEGTSYPAIVAQRFGQGQTGAVLIGDFWRWAMHQDPEDRDLEKAWRQIIRWLVSDVPERIESRVEPAPDSPADLVRITTRVRTKTFEPLDNAVVVLSVVPPDGQAARLDAEPSLTEAGVYEAFYATRQPGAYRADVTVSDDQSAEIGKAQIGWSADPAADEFREIRPNRPLLDELAKQSGGEVVDRASLESFVAGLPSRQAPITEQWSYPLWHRLSVFLFAVACLVVEWGVRRWRGLP